MVTASLVAFGFSAQFISLLGLEIPYYVVLLGAGALKLQSVGSSCQTQLAAQPITVTPRLPGFIEL
jgi:hypothetical protein